MNHPSKAVRELCDIQQELLSSFTNFFHDEFVELFELIRGSIREAEVHPLPNWEIQALRDQVQQLINKVNEFRIQANS